MRRRRIIAARYALALVGCSLGVANALAGNVSFWVWNRSTPLSAVELAELNTANVRQLYWHAGELENSGDGWRWRRPAFSPPASGLHIVPVIRLDSIAREPFAGSALKSLLNELRAAIEQNSWRELQIDCDTPDRLLGQYAIALAEIRRLLPRLSVTALAGWSRSVHWHALQQSVDEIFPMFYDLHEDAPRVGLGATPRPLLDETEVARQLQEWSQCRIPWRAGLPNFGRVTVYDHGGKSRGHIRAWRWNDLCFDPALLKTEARNLMTVLLRVGSDTRLGASVLRAGESVAVRLPDRGVLHDAVRRSEAAQASGVVFFRLPEPSAPSGWSLRQLRQLGAPAEAQLRLRREADGRFRLTNASDVDLAPRLAGPDGERDRGYALEVDTDHPIWREAMEGEFWRVTGHANPEGQAERVTIPLATRLTFWFSHLPAGAELRSGLIIPAPNASAGDVRYRILNAPGASEWRAIGN
ncbi:MAG TPA: DUF3142 domain-containing protein [Chthoniobacterales bacterium]|nr:DUF3142 domain-containing protein [Chthoniobacterales bacterium]